MVFHGESKGWWSHNVRFSPWPFQTATTAKPIDFNPKCITFAVRVVELRLLFSVRLGFFLQPSQRVSRSREEEDGGKKNQWIFVWLAPLVCSAHPVLFTISSSSQPWYEWHMDSKPRSCFESGKVGWEYVSEIPVCVDGRPCSWTIS